MSRLIIENISDLSLKETLDCGQCFRWKELPDGGFRGIVRGRTATVHTDGDRLIIDGAEEADRVLWEDHFDLSLDYGAVKEQLALVHPEMAQAVRFAPGIRILRQEPFEALITFIISQNNNIKRIAGIVDRLCENFGEEIDGGHAFPTAQRLAALSPDDLAPIRAGFRHRYIIDAAQKVADGTVNLEEIRVLPIDQARRQLMQITGVGVKVADCVLLYGLHRLDSFPLDVWMKRAMATLFDGMNPQLFGEYAGIAQQYIFHYARLHPERFTD